MCQTRAAGLGLTVEVSSEDAFTFSKEVCGALVQYPATDGSIHHYEVRVIPLTLFLFRLATYLRHVCQLQAILLCPRNCSEIQNSLPQPSQGCNTMQVKWRSACTTLSLRSACKQSLHFLTV